jgi:hypothetical protein
MNKQRTYFPRVQPVYRSYAPGLVDLFTDPIALSAGLNVEWVLKLLANPLRNESTMFEWREHFVEMKREYSRIDCAA